MLQTTVIPNRSVSSTTTLRDPSGRAWVRLRTLLAAGVQAWIARRDERQLMEMPDHLLKDIGIGRSEIPSAVRQGRA
ncbi:MAG TPA: DUF1127 domain-containing protein [Dongiaceae bacterium]|nr:DUF1127 domain-containing protein [Dongiaceae bacterium]